MMSKNSGGVMGVGKSTAKMYVQKAKQELRLKTWQDRKRLWNP